MKARFIKQIGVKGRLRIYWEKKKLLGYEKCDSCDETHPSYEFTPECPNSYGLGNVGIHNAYSELGVKLDTEDFKAFGSEENYSNELWPTACQACGVKVPLNVPEPIQVDEEGYRLVKQVFVSRFYDNESGSPQIGDIYQLKHEDRSCIYWDNCDGIHTYGLLPNGHTWDINSRASNCTLKDDRTHRCWVATGSVFDGTLDVGKNGNTCDAGAGSIQAGSWHGFLRNFTWEG